MTGDRIRRALEIMFYAPLAVLVAAWLYFADRAIQRAQRKQRRKAEEARRRSDSIDDWSELKRDAE